MSSSQNNKILTKDKLLGMKVIDSEGKLVGPVKDIGFTIGKQGVSLIIENDNGETREIEWDRIQGASDFIILKPEPQTQQTAPASQKETEKGEIKNICKECKGQLTYIPQYKRWYCYTCQKYA